MLFCIDSKNTVFHFSVLVTVGVVFWGGSKNTVFHFSVLVTDGVVFWGGSKNTVFNFSVLVTDGVVFWGGSENASDAPWEWLQQCHRTKRFGYWRNLSPTQRQTRTLLSKY